MKDNSVQFDLAARFGDDALMKVRRCAAAQADGTEAHRTEAQRARWDRRCAEILRRNAHRYTNAEIAALIEADTGLRFRFDTISRRRAALGLDCPRRNDWAAPLRRWRMLLEEGGK